MPPPTTHSAEVILVGAGPAGATLATFLAQAGVHVCLLDRAQFPRDKACAEYLSPQASRILDELGVLGRIEAAGALSLRGMQVTAPNGATFTGAFAAAHGYRGFRDAGLALRRTVFDALLVARAVEAGAELIEEAHVRDVVREGPRVTGVTGEHHGTPTTWRAPLVIGADGLRSVVARRLGLARRHRWPVRYALVTHYRDVAGMALRGEMFVTHGGGYCGLAPVDGALVNVALVMPPRDAAGWRGDPERALDSFVASHKLLAGRFTSASRVSPVLATGPFASRATRVGGPGFALVGDAAEFFDPFTGEGVYAALRGAELLTSYAFEAVRAATPSRQHAALDAWHRAHRDEFRGKRRVEWLIGSAIAYPRLFNRIAAGLAQRPDMADLLVGVAGDFVPPGRVLHPTFLAQLIVAAVRGAAPSAASSQS